MFGGIQGNTEKIFTVLMTCFTTHVSLGSSLPMGNGNTCLNSWQQGFRVPCPRGPVSSWCLITLSHAPLSLCTYGPPTPCACCWAWDHIGSAVCPSHYSPPKRVRLQCSVNLVFFLLLNVELRGRRAQCSTELPVHPVPSCALCCSLARLLWWSVCTHPAVQQECFSHVEAPETSSLGLAS